MPTEYPEEDGVQRESLWMSATPAKEISPNYVAVVIVSVLLAIYASMEFLFLMTQRPYPGGLLNQIDSGLFGFLSIFSAAGMLFRWSFAHKTAIIMLLAHMVILVPLTSFIILPSLTPGLSIEETQLVINGSMAEAFFFIAFYGVLLFTLTRPRVVAVFGRG